MNQQQESKIIELAQQNIAEFELVYQETVSDVFRYIYSICRRKELTEDVVSKTYLKAMKKIKTYVDTGRPFKAWLFTIARNTLYNEFSVTKGTLSIDDEAESIPDESSESALLELIKKETSQNIAELLQKLSEEVQEIFFLKHEEELTFDVIAAIQEVSVSAVKMKYYRAVEKLRSILSN